MDDRRSRCPTSTGSRPCSAAPWWCPASPPCSGCTGPAEHDKPKAEALDLDLYVDSSGSIANPQVQLSFLALAGAIIAMSCLRSGGRVQATLWSGAQQFETTDGFVTDVDQVLRIMTGYIGGATAFPIHVLRDTYAERDDRARPVHILVISDAGVTTMFDRDERGGDGVEIARTALERARGRRDDGPQPLAVARRPGTGHRHGLGRHLDRRLGRAHRLRPPFRPAHVLGGQVVTEGPSVAALVHRLASCPDDFLAPPRAGGSGVVAVAAVVGDTLRALGAELPADWLVRLAPPAADIATRNWLQGCLVTSWLVADPVWQGRLAAEELLSFLDQDLRRLGALVPGDALVRDPDRREELARLLVRAAGLTPDGETAAHAADRLSTLDSVTRTRVEAEARAAEERAREVRAALARERAAEAAARASRE